MFNQTYFEFIDLINPLPAIDRVMNPYRHQSRVTLNGYPLQLSWTPRAERALQRRSTPLSVEMQLYFSCVLKKRVLFDRPGGEGFTPAGNRLALAFHAVEATACDPVAFAENYPERRRLENRATARMHPRELRLDFRRGQWLGEFEI